jgi:hypothetical protein
MHAATSGLAPADDVALVYLNLWSLPPINSWKISRKINTPLKAKIKPSCWGTSSLDILSGVCGGEWRKVGGVPVLPDLLQLVFKVAVVQWLAHVTVEPRL